MNNPIKLTAKQRQIARLLKRGIIQAFASGKTLQWWDECNESWRDYSDHKDAFCRWRIKPASPKPTAREPSAV